MEIAITFTYPHLKYVQWRAKGEKSLPKSSFPSTPVRYTRIGMITLGFLYCTIITNNFYLLNYLEFLLGCY